MLISHFQVTFHLFYKGLLKIVIETKNIYSTQFYRNLFNRLSKASCTLLIAKNACVMHMKCKTAYCS